MKVQHHIINSLGREFWGLLAQHLEIEVPKEYSEKAAILKKIKQLWETERAGRLPDSGKKYAG